MPNKKKRNFLSENYIKSWRYIKESRRFIYSIIGVFVLFILIGAFLPVPEAVRQQILDFIEKLLAQTEGLSLSGMIEFIFLNNLQSSFFGMAFGIAFGIFPFINAVVNGYLLGFVVARVVETDGVFVLWRIFPHGVFELPALFLSLGMGVRLGTFIFEKEKIKNLNYNLKESLRVFLFVVIPFLIIAAFIEGVLIFL